MELSLQSVHPDILARIVFYLPLSSRLRLAATCRSMESRVGFKHGRSQLESLPSSVLHRIIWRLSRSDRLRIGAASWTLRKWAIQNGTLTLHCYDIVLTENRFEFYGVDTIYNELVGVLPFRDDDLPIRVAARSLYLDTDFSRAHIDQSIRRISAFRPPPRPDSICLSKTFSTLSGQSDDPTAVRRLVEYLGGTSKSFDRLQCYTKSSETLLLESDFLHRVPVRNVYLRVGDIGPDGLDFVVEDSVQEEDAQLRGEYPRVDVDLGEREHSMSSPPMVFNSLLRFIRAHFSPSPNVRFKYDVTLRCCGADGSAAIRTLADECGVQLETHRDEREETLRFKTSSDPTRRIDSRLCLNTAEHNIFVGADQKP